MVEVISRRIRNKMNRCRGFRKKGVNSMMVLGGMAAWNTPLLIILVCISVWYCFWAKKHPDIRFSQFYWFHAGIGLFYLLIGSPLYVLSHLTFITHMLQMSILYFFVPPLLLLGIPGRLGQKWKKRNISSFLALIIFSILFFLYHLPQVLPFLYKNLVIHTSYILCLFALSFLMWFPVITPGSSLKRYSWWSSILLMPACLLLILNGLLGGQENSPLFSQLMLKLCIPSDQSAALLPFQMNTKADQILGGLLMLALHKFSLMVAIRLGSQRMCLKNLKLKPSLHKME